MSSKMVYSKTAPAGNRGLIHHLPITDRGLAVNATRPPCTIDGCTRPQYGREVCSMHYQRLRKTGDPNCVRVKGPKPVDVTGQRFGSLTAIARDGGSPSRGKWRLSCDCGGETSADYGALKAGLVIACNNYRVHRWQEDITYNGVHRRIRRAKGSASGHTCTECGRQAREWSYDHADLAERSENGLRYSLDPDHYVPSCAKCHRRRDANRRRSE